MKSLRVLIFAFVFIALPFVSTAEAYKNYPREVDDETIVALFETWNAALQTGNPEAVADLYAQDAVLLPTVSNRVRYDRAGIIDYFEHFLAYRPSGVIEENKVRIKGNLAINSGIYAFTLHQGDEINIVRARFTYVYEWRGDQWLIVEHHSSTLPEKE